MIKIVRTKDNKWGIMAPQAGVVMEPAEFSEMIDQAAALGIAPEELECAFTEMYAREHNCAHFGAVNRMFIFTEVVTIITRQDALQPSIQQEFVRTDSAPILMVGLA
jgi:hypothetical protein